MRSGSTALTHALNEHPGLKTAMEPFHEKYSEWHLRSPDYKSLIKDRHTARFYSDELFEQYNGMKFWIIIWLQNVMRRYCCATM